jgi:hypothetical protein
LRTAVADFIGVAPCNLPLRWLSLEGLFVMAVVVPVVAVGGALEVAGRWVRARP